MPKYLVQASYNATGLQGLAKDGAAAREALVKKMAKSVGGKVESFYFAFGDYDVIVIADFPDNASAAAISMAASATGAVRLKTTPLLTVADATDALGKAVNYRAPGA